MKVKNKYYKGWRVRFAFFPKNIEGISVWLERYVERYVEKGVPCRCGCSCCVGGWWEKATYQKYLDNKDSNEN